MKLIGMLDSPFVRRTAIALQLLDVPFEHAPLSVFSTFQEVSEINPAVKVPTLVCDDGTVLMESGLIIDHLETITGRSLWPAHKAERLRALRITGLALAACDKVLQEVYERNLRPDDKQHEPWMERIAVQRLGAFKAIDAELGAHPLSSEPRHLTQAGITAAVAWRFMQIKLAQPIDARTCPALAAYSDKLEALPVFARTGADETVNASTC